MKLTSYDLIIVYSLCPHSCETMVYFLLLNIMVSSTLTIITVHYDYEVNLKHAVTEIKRKDKKGDKRN